SSGDALVEACVARLREQADARFGLTVERTHWFNGISDLSYLAGQGEPSGWTPFERNCPVYGARYSVPFEAMHALAAPVLNVGPFGTDPHQRTERLHVRNAFAELPELLADLVQFVAAQVAPAS
ncbi:MAG: amino acid degradation protein, partial [Thermoleophilia bacterium]|nr:amino acid degradation protein [Thermoleophilia bacterium]